MLLRALEQIGTMDKRTVYVLGRQKDAKGAVSLRLRKHNNKRVETPVMVYAHGGAMNGRLFRRRGSRKGRR